MSSLEAVPALPHRPDPWAATQSTCCVRYRIKAQAQPALLCQVLNLLAMQYLVPLQVSVQRQDQDLYIELDVDGLARHRAGVIGEKMRNLIDVDAVQIQAYDGTMQPEPPLERATA